MKAIFGTMLVALFSLGAVLPVAAQTPEVTHNTWTSGAAMLTAVAGPAGTAVLKGEIYVVGGLDSSGTVTADTQIYNPVANTWSTGVALPTATQGGSAAGAPLKPAFGLSGLAALSTLTAPARTKSSPDSPNRFRPSALSVQTTSKGNLPV